MSDKKTDGERIVDAIRGMSVSKQYLAARIDRLVRRRMAEAWAQGYEGCFRYGELSINPHKGRRKKA